MDELILSIYVPTYNREDYLCQLLGNLKQEIGEYKASIEVVISDNCSQDQTEVRAKEICQQYVNDGFRFIYHRNETNIGGSRNYIQCTDYVSGKYCWIIGDDDILLNNSIKTVMETIALNEEKNIEYYCVNYAYVKMHERERYLQNVESQKEIDAEWHFFRDYEVKVLEGFGSLFMIDSKKPTHICTFLGGNIFSCDAWKRLRGILDLDKESKLGKSVGEDFHMTLDYVFPHLKIAAKGWMHHAIGYIGVPCVGLGVGAQEHSSQNWRYIETVVFDELADWYLKCEMPRIEYQQFLKDFLPRLGNGLINLMAENDEQFGKEDFAILIRKYSENDLFLNAFLSSVDEHMVSPSQVRYDDYCIKGMENNVRRYIDEHKKIAIWGTGEMAHAILENCEGLKGYVSILVDGNKKKWGMQVEGTLNDRIQPPEVLLKEHVDLIIVSSIYYADDIINHIREMKIKVDVLSSKGFIRIL